MHNALDLLRTDIIEKHSLHFISYPYHFPVSHIICPSLFTILVIVEKAGGTNLVNHIRRGGGTWGAVTVLPVTAPHVFHTAIFRPLSAGRASSSFLPKRLV